MPPKNKIKNTRTTPQWARYRARDRDGWVYFYSLEPRARSHGWVSGGVRQRDESIQTQFRADNWIGTLEKI